MAAAISLTWSEGVSEVESDILIQTVHQTLNWLYFRHPDAFFEPPIRVQSFGNWVIPAMVDRGPYWGTQWYVENAYDRELDRVIAPVLLELLRREPWQELSPHLDLFLLSEDMTDFPAPLARQRPTYYSLGASFPGEGAVMSVFRLRTLADEREQELALARLVRHHLGHVLTIPPFGQSERVQRRGLETHCTNECVMRHAETLDQLVAYAKEEASMGWPFCPRCTRALHSVIVHNSGNWS